MGDKTVTAKEARERIKHLLDLVKNGEEVLISEDDKVFARIAPVRVPSGRPELDGRRAPAEKAKKKRRTPGLHRGVVKWISPDFDEPLPDSFWLGDEESSS